MSVYHMPAWSWQKTEEFIRSLGIGAGNWSCELPYGYKELNPGPLEGNPVLLTTVQAFYPSLFVFNFKLFLLENFLI